VFVGQRICGVGEGNVAGSGTYTRDGFIYASLAGYVTRIVSDDKMVFTLCISILFIFVIYFCLSVYYTAVII